MTVLVLVQVLILVRTAVVNYWILNTIVYIYIYSHESLNDTFQFIQYLYCKTRKRCFLNYNFSGFNVILISMVFLLFTCSQ